MAERLLDAAERFCSITLAEPGYRRLFDRDHPVFPNYPASGGLPDPAPSDGSVVYVGDVTEARGALDMVEAAATSSRPLTVIGRCPGDIAEQMQALAADRGVDLTLSGWLPHRKAMERVATAAIGLSLLHDLPNYRHSMPTKLVEYLQLGIPVVASDLPGSRDGTAGLSGITFVPPRDPAAAAAAIDATADDDALRADLAVAAAGLRQELVWPAAEVRAFYRELLD